MSDCIVVGAGLIGMLTARELALAGLQVRVIDQGESGRESSWAGGGILSPLYPWRYPAPVTRLARWGQERYQELAEELALESGIDPQWTLSGMLVLGVDADERDEAIGWAVQYGYDIEYLEQGGLRHCEQALGEGFGSGLWLPQVAQVRNPRLLQALRKSLEGLGVRFVERCRVNAIAVEHGRLVGVQSEQGLLRAARVIVASGAWSAGLLAPLGYGIEVEPVRGQMLLFKGEPGLLRRIVLYDNHYVIPRRDGHILAGSTLERTGFDKYTTEQGRDELQQAAFELVPALASCPIEHHWAGLRPGSPEGVPYIGGHPRIAGLYVNTGHFRNGVVLGLASARLLSDLVNGKSPILDPAPYALAGGE